MKIKISEADIKAFEQMSSQQWCDRLVTREIERRNAFWAPISQRAEEAFVNYEASNA